MTPEEERFINRTLAKLYGFKVGKNREYLNNTREAIFMREAMLYVKSHFKSPWISVKDDLPCNHKELTPKDYTVEVLALDDCDSYIVVRMWKFHDKWVWGLDDLPITHWMTLPTLPKE